MRMKHFLLSLTAVALVAVSMYGGLNYLGEGTDYERTGSGFKVDLQRMNPEVSIEGEAELVPDTSSMIVTISLKHARKARTYMAHVHAGSCDGGAGGGVSLNSIEGTAGDTDFSKSRVVYDDLELNRSHLIMVHKPDRRHALCGNIPPIKQLGD